VRAAVHVDHIVAVTHGGDDSAWDDSNRQGLCAACHAIKTAQDMGYVPPKIIGIDGYPIDG
jgi:5-methylcytosine-specific restriction endonuclease McrA